MNSATQEIRLSEQMQQYLIIESRMYLLEKLHNFIEQRDDSKAHTLILKKMVICSGFLKLMRKKSSMERV